jgi:hypothetical protein
MDQDVLTLLLRLLQETQFPVYGSELAKLAELHDRAVSQVQLELGKGSDALA